MTTKTFSLVPIKDLVERHRLTHIFSYAHALKHEPDRLIAVYEGDVVLPALALDWPEAESVPDKDIFGYLVTGNLTVTTQITCRETDGGLGLVVLGDLRAGNIAVGGQELYVRGNVAVDGVYCGSYNHGESIIDGDVEARLLISDDYRFWIKGTLLAPTATTGRDRIGLLDGRDMDPKFDYKNDTSGIGYGGARWTDGEIPLSYALVEECLDDDDIDWPFMFGALVRRIRAGEPVLSPDCDLQSAEASALREANALFVAGNTAYYDDDNAYAANLFEQALGAGFSEKRCRYMLGLSLYDDDHYKEAISHFTYCIDHDYHRQEALAKRASSLLLSLTGDEDDVAYAAAWTDCEQAILIGKFGNGDTHHLAEAHNLKGYSLYLQRKYADAIVPLACALEVEEENHNANANMAKCLWHLDREPEALPYAEQAVAVDPDEDYPHLIKAHCHYAVAQYEAARRSYERYLKSDPDHELARIRLARCLVALNRLDEAHVEATRLFASHPGQKTANPDGFVAWALWLTDREEDALPYAIRSAEVTPAPGYHFLIKGCCLKKAGETEAALADWNAYAAVAPDDIGVWNLLAENYLDIDLKASRRCLDRALAINPDNAVAHDLDSQYKERCGRPIQSVLRAMAFALRLFRRR